MSLKPIPLFGLGNQGKSVNVNAQKRTNLYCQIEADSSEKNVVTMYPTPGLTTFVNFGANPDRAFYVKDNFQYHVNGSSFFRVANDGTMTSLGTLVTSGGRCDVIDNGQQIIVVDGANGYIYDLSVGTFTQITAPGWAGGTTVSFLNGYFIVSRPNSGQFAISGSYDGTAWDALEFASAESSPDNLVRVFVENGMIILFGETTTEFWGDTAAQDFPFARIGASAIEWGLAARWSVAKYMDSVAFLCRNRLGQVQVRLLSGNSSVPITNAEMEYVFSQYSAVEDATGFSYMIAGHPFYQINFPTANESWIYDGQSKTWDKVSSGSMGGRHRGNIQASYLNQSYVTDAANGKVYKLDENVYTDDGEPIVREFISRHQSTGNFSRFAQMWIEMEAGVGTVSGQGANPKIMLDISKDGGHTWGAVIVREFGKIGQYKRRAVFNRLGRSRDWLYRFRVTDPVKTVFVAAWGRASV